MLLKITPPSSRILTKLRVIRPTPPLPPAVAVATLPVVFKRMSGDWQSKSSHLSEVEKHVIWNKGTERPGTGEYDKFFPKTGHFACKVCNTPLYSAASKFHSGCGWPAFDKCYSGAVASHVDTSFGMKRIEIVCGTCGGHLGHVFEGERFTATNERHCVNSVSVKFVETELTLPEAKVV